MLQAPLCGKTRCTQLEINLALLSDVFMVSCKMRARHWFQSWAITISLPRKGMSRDCYSCWRVQIQSLHSETKDIIPWVAPGAVKLQPLANTTLEIEPADQ